MGAGKARDRDTMTNIPDTEGAEKFVDRMPPELQREIIDLLNKHAGSNGTDQQSERFRIYTAADALKPQPPIDWIVENLVAPGSTQLWAGEGGSKKTYSLLDLGVCIALGKPWLDMPTRQCPVLIIDEESGPRRLARRLGEVLRGHFAGPETPIYYITLALFNLREPADLAHLHSAINEVGAGFVVIDALVDVMPGADENAAGDVHPVFQGMRSVADATESCLITIHHNNKAGSYRGSTAMKGAVDVVVNVKSPPKEGKVEFDLEKSRDSEEFAWAAECRWVEDTFDMVRVEPEESRPVLGKAERYVLRFLEEHGASEVRIIQEHADSCTSRAARNAVYSLADKQMVKRIDGGGQEKAATYDLTEEGRKWS